MENAKSVPLLSRVRHVEEVFSYVQGGPREHTNKVNDYLNIEGWILLNTGTQAGRGDNGPYAAVYYSLGWIGEGEPQIPNKSQPLSAPPPSQPLP